MSHQGLAVMSEVMIRNIPTEYKQDELILEVSEAAALDGMDGMDGITITSSELLPPSFLLPSSFLPPSFLPPPPNSELQVSVGNTGPQPRAPDVSGHCQTSTASSNSQ